MTGKLFRGGRMYQTNAEREAIILYAVREELITWAQVRFGIRVDEEAIFGLVCERITNIVKKR